MCVEVSRESEPRVNDTKPVSARILHVCAQLNLCVFLVLGLLNILPHTTAGSPPFS